MKKLSLYWCFVSIYVVPNINSSHWAIFWRKKSMVPAQPAAASFKGKNYPDFSSHLTAFYCAAAGLLPKKRPKGEKGQ
ncbi:MAG: hypothetical protein HYW50_01240 [Candidatus Diapherotrites archaeon]|nr:hypothetical protein [Candidatus Diapherotrites archaeon]